MKKVSSPLFGFTNFLALSLLVTCVAFPSLAMATDRRDLLVGLKTLPMLDNALTGSVSMAIIYDPSNSECESDANTIKSILDEGLQMAGGSKISGFLLPVSEINKLSQGKLAFVTQGVRGYFDAIAKAAVAAGSLTMSADLECVRANKCVLGIVSQPVVEIYYSRAASAATKIDFDPAFTMLVKKV